MNKDNARRQTRGMSISIYIYTVEMLPQVYMNAFFLESTFVPDCCQYIYRHRPLGLEELANQVSMSL